MTLDEAIKYAQDKADSSTCGCEHQQLACWLTELRSQLERAEKQRDELKAYWFDDVDPAETKYAFDFTLAKLGADKTGEK